MGAFLTLAFLVLVGPLSIWLGADSPVEPRARRATAAGAARASLAHRYPSEQYDGRPAGP